MRKIYLVWSIAVFGIFGTIYGAYLLIYHLNHGNGVNVLALLLLILDLFSLGLFLGLYIASYIAQKKKKNEVPPAEEKPAEETKEEVKIVAKPLLKQEIKQEGYVQKETRTYESSSPRYSYSTVYVKQVGYGPILRIEGNRIIDMRSNTYYRLENNMLTQEGYGPVFEIRGNQIKNAFGGYLYEISGSNINKTFGGFYASISGNYITLYDLSVKYEMTDSLSRSQLLAAVALLFGKY